MKKTIIIAVIAIILLGSGIFFFTNSRQSDQTSDQTQEQAVLESTLNISREYASLRYRTDNVLINAVSYADYDAWNSEMSVIIKEWEDLEKNALSLENLANEMAGEKVSLKFTNQALAYTKEEITSVIDKAPAGRMIRTLAQFLGVDAKMAQLVLNQSQDEISREAYGEEGDVFQTCENQAIVVKNASKVTLFVGTIALTGGTAAIASGGTLAQTAVIVSGADLTLEITDDTARMALGDKNKISSFVGDARKITEPVAAILMISTLPTNLVKGIDKLNAVVFSADQLNSTIQSGAVIGIKLPTPTKEKPEPATEVSVLEKEEIDQWIKDNSLSVGDDTKEEVEAILGININDKKIENLTEEVPRGNNEEAKNEEETVNQDLEKTDQAEKESEAKSEIKTEQLVSENNTEVAGVWKGILKHTPSQTSSEKQIEYMIDLNDDGTVSAVGNGKAFSFWKKEGNSVKLLFKDGSGGYYEFALSGDALTFIKLAGLNSEGEWQEDFAGEDFFGGKFYEILLKKQ